MDKGNAVERLSGGRLWLFALSQAPLAALGIAIAVYLPQHFARNLGMDLAAVGAAFAIVRLIDLPVDPLLGVMMDRTRSRWGRYRLWMLAGMPIAMAAIYMLFMAPFGITSGYVIVWALVLYLGTSMIGLAHSAWATTLAPDYNERSRVFGAIGSASVAGMSLVLLMPLISTQLMGRPDSQNTVAMGWFILATTPIFTLAAGLLIREHLTPHRPAQGVALRDYVGLLTNPNMARIAIASLLFTLGTSWESGLYMFYFIDVRRFTGTEASLLLMGALAAGLVGAPAVGKLARVLSKHTALMLVSGAYGAALLSLWLIPATAPKLLVCLPICVSGFLYSGFLVLLRAMTADISDEIRLQQGKERSALLFAVLTLTPKVASAFAIWMTFTVLAYIGYRPAEGTGNTAEALGGLQAAYILGPNGFVLLGAACMIGYGLTRSRAAEIRRELDKMDAAARETPESGALSPHFAA